MPGLKSKENFYIENQYLMLMLRRDIFNLLFVRNTNLQPIVAVPDPVIVTPDYLLSDPALVYCREWNEPLMPAKLNAEFSTIYAFTLTVTANVENAMLNIGAITMGLNNGCLFIDAVTDYRIISEQDVQKGIKIILKVNPQPNGASHVRLSAIDQSGLTLAVVKSTKYLSQNWAGAITLSTAFSSLRIDGVQTNKIKVT